MSKAAEARVRTELLQALYAGVLRVRLAGSLAGAAAPSGTEAVAAGLEANLAPADLLALPQRGGVAVRVLRGARAAANPSAPARDLHAGLLTLPRAEPGAVNFVLGAVAATVHSARGAAVCVLLPPSAQLGTPGPAGTALPESWAELGGYATRHSLPVLFVSDGLAGVASPGPEQPAPPFPTIPVDRDDALAVYRVAFECVQRARLGAGPSHLAAVPFRPRGHRPGEPDALARLETMLRTRGEFGKTWRHALERRLIRELSEH